MARLAMVFPGQGSQSAGMMRGYGDLAAVRDTIAEASDVLREDLARLMADGPDAELARTVNTQPVMMTAGYAVYRAWRELGGPMPEVVAGHSLGEYTALVVAGVLSFADGLRLVRVRATAMQEAAPLGVGAMAAVLGLADDVVRDACADAAADEVVAAANFNAPEQVVIAGHAAAVRRASEACKARGAKRVIALPVSAPFHCALMAPAATRLRGALARLELRPPRITVIHNVDARSRDDVAGIREALVRQADHPVRWVECVRAIAARGVTHVLECGPGRVLAPLVRRISPDLDGLALAHRAAIDDALRVVRPPTPSAS
jgi:[acyl-carrier-protein] S-malonyltransferase